MSLIVDWLFPKNCFGCHKGNKYICRLCENKMILGSLTKTDNFEGIISIYKYDGLMKNIIEIIKYEYVTNALEELAILMGNNLLLKYPNVIRYWQKEKYTMIPIPLFWQRKNWRGFNQSEILAIHLADFLNLRCETDILFKNKNTKNQATIKNREIRRKNIINVFEVNQEKIVPEKIILIDDVITSGATMTAALKTLRGFGASRAWGLGLSGVQK
ncbi:MAG: hypothetical protein WC503_01400 [Candidatus Shapirobacteria bacterium]